MVFMVTVLSPFITEDAGITEILHVLCALSGRSFLESRINRLGGT